MLVCKSSSSPYREPSPNELHYLQGSILTGNHFNSERAALVMVNIEIDHSRRRLLFCRASMPAMALHSAQAGGFFF